MVRSKNTRIVVIFWAKFVDNLAWNWQYLHVPDGMLSSNLISILAAVDSLASRAE